jgi:hypothetical protein
MCSGWGTGTPGECATLPLVPGALCRFLPRTVERLQAASFLIACICAQATSAHGKAEVANLGEGLLPSLGHLAWGVVGSLDSIDSVRVVPRPPLKKRPQMGIVGPLAAFK